MPIFRWTRFKEATTLLAELEGTPNHENNFGTAYAVAAAPSRIPLELEDWTAAANLPVALHPSVSWERYPQAVAIRWFVIGIGAARTGQTQAAESALSELASLMALMEVRKAGYWLGLSQAQSKGIQAWLSHHSGDDEAANIEDKVGKAPVTPRHALPARELFGDLFFLEIGDKACAAEAYGLSLAVSPNRRRSLMGLSAASDK